MNSENDIYIFDFDDTLVRVSSKVQVRNKNTGELIEELSPNYFIEFYESAPDQIAEFVDSDTYQKMPFFNILKEATSKFGKNTKKHVWICTARYSPDGPKRILQAEGIHDVSIAAVGKKEKAGDVVFHAKQKKAFVARMIKRFKPTSVFFYDDSYLNLSEVGSLSAELQAKIILINSVDHKITVLRP